MDITLKIKIYFCLIFGYCTLNILYYIIHSFVTYLLYTFDESKY